MWQSFALCASADNVDIWDLDGTTPEQRQEAVDTCKRCPVLARCFETAVADPPLMLIQAGYGWRRPSNVPFDAVKRRMPPMVKPELPAVLSTPVQPTQAPIVGPKSAAA